jgi:hypothetical protein
VAALRRAARKRAGPLPIDVADALLGERRELSEWLQRTSSVRSRDARCLNNHPPRASIALRSTSSWAASAARIPSASASHRRVEPSTSVNKNVTTPEGAAAAGADTPAESHNRHAPTRHIGGIRPRPRRGARRGVLPVGRIAAIWHMLAGQR